MSNLPTIMTNYFRGYIISILHSDKAFLLYDFLKLSLSSFRLIEPIIGVLESRLISSFNLLILTC